MRFFATTLMALLIAGVLVMGGCGQKGDLYRENNTPENAEEDEEG